MLSKTQQSILYNDVDVVIKCNVGIYNISAAMLHTLCKLYGTAIVLMFDA